jgi:hypothetical protein
LPNLYRKFGPNYDGLIESICRSELMNFGQKFSIDDFRTKRLKITEYLNAKLRRKLEQEYSINLFGLYFDRLRFTDQINKLNLKRMINGILNEKAMYEKNYDVTVAETQLRVKQLKNQAELVLQKAKHKTENEIIKIEQKNADVKLELVHLSGLNKGLHELDFISKSGSQSKNATQRIISYCYMSALANLENVKIIPQESLGVLGGGYSKAGYIRM